MSRRVTTLTIPFVSAIVILGLLALSPSARAWSGYKHGTAQSKGACTAGCHAETTLTNTTCTRCHTGFKTRGTQKCWDCHEPGQSTTSLQLLAGCTTTCHISTATGDRPSYTVSFTHSATVHSGASGYGKTCLDCHGVSTGSTTPGTSPHHDAANSAAPTCAGCHDGGIAAAPTGHTGYGTNCASCHTGMDRPSGDCATCHVGRSGTSTPQITYSNSLTCGDAACHGKVANHAGTPIGAASCTTCHAGHYQSLGACETCHPQPQTFHHGTAVARPLTDCAGCHNGGTATAKASHGAVACSTCHTGMAAASVPVTCNGCHLAKKFGAGTCTACHSPTGLTGREQVHAATPRAGLTCTGCHSAHNADLGSCTSCHGLVPQAHHGVATITGAALTLQAAPQSVSPGAEAVVSGNLADAAGAPLQGAEVLLQQRRLGDGDFSDAATLFTGEDGSFSWPVQPVAATEYRVVHRGSWWGSPRLCAGLPSPRRPCT